MSQAQPMTHARRLWIYGLPLTDRQWRQFDRMADRQINRLDRQLTHGATGERIRRPLVRVSLPPERGSIRTHTAAYCAPCDQHSRPRLHRHPIKEAGQS